MWIEKVEEIRSSKNPDSVKNTIFEGILNSKLPEEEKTTARLAHEAQLVVFAGEGTTAYTLQAALFQLLANPSIFEKLKAEITTALPDPHEVPSYSQVEKLPFLSAVVQETIRVHPGVVSRLPRVSPDIPTVYKDRGKGAEYILPPGTSTNMTTQIAHMNPDVFENPYDFRPQRWIDNPRLDKGFIGFARGTRNCIGYVSYPKITFEGDLLFTSHVNSINFARQEMSMVLASIVRKYNIYSGQDGPTLELHNTTRERDIDLNRDYIIPFPATGSHGLCVRVRN